MWSRRAAAAPNVRIVQDDIARPHSGWTEFDILRAANVLNVGYFSSLELRAMCANLLERLRPGGMLIVCRTVTEGSPAANAATVLHMDGGRPRVIGRLNGGSEAEPFLLG